MLAELCVFSKVRVGEQCRPRAFRIALSELFHIRLCRLWLSHSRIEQEQMIENVCHVLIFRIAVGDASESLFAQRQVVELVLEYHSGVVQTVHYYKVACLDLFLRERNLFEIVFPFVRIVLRAVGYLLERVCQSFRPGDGVELLFGHLLRCVKRHDGLVDTLPVVHVFPFSPYLLELRLALVHSHLVVEIPHRALVARSLVLPVGVAGVSGVASVLRYHVLRVLLRQPVLLLLLLFLQFLYHTVNRLIALFLAHLCQCLKRVLQVYGVCVRHELVEDLRPPRQFLIVLALLVEQTYRLAVAPLRVAVAFALPVKTSELQQEYAFLYAVACRAAVSLFVCNDGVERVFLCQIYVSDGIVHLIQIILVLV